MECGRGACGATAFLPALAKPRGWKGNAGDDNYQNPGRSRLPAGIAEKKFRFAWSFFPFVVVY
jgi:hypothetical protein